MTAAVCVGCGAMKHGVLVACQACGFTPVQPLHLAYAFAYSDHYFSDDKLREISREVIETKEIPALSPEVEAKFVNTYGRLRANWD